MLWEFALVILLLVLTVLVILLIPTVVRFFRILHKLDKTLEDINRDLPKIMENVEEISDHTARATRGIDRALGDILEIQQKFSAELKEPALDTIATLAGMFKGLQTFMMYFIKKHK